MLSSRVSEIERLVLLVETLVCILFGHSSEKILGQIEQLDLQLEELSAGDAVEERRAAPSFPGCHPAKISIPSPLRAIGPVFLGTVVSVNNVLMHQNRRLAKSASPTLLQNSTNSILYKRAMKVFCVLCLVLLATSSLAAQQAISGTLQGNGVNRTYLLHRSQSSYRDRLLQRSRNVANDGMRRQF
jgi:hypothetical protein